MVRHAEAKKGREKHMPFFSKKVLILGDIEEDAYIMEMYMKQNSFMIMIASRYISSKEDIEDVVADSFLKIIEKIDRIKRMDSMQISAYIAITVRHKCIDFIRKNNRKQFRERFVGQEELEQMSDGESVERKIILDEELHMIQSAILNLPEPERILLQMKVYENKSTKEIAQTTGLSEGVVRKKIQRAREQIIVKIY